MPDTASDTPASTGSLPPDSASDSLLSDSATDSFLPDSATESDSNGISGTDTTCDIDLSFDWIADETLVSPPEGYVSIKDPSVILVDGIWHVFVTSRRNGTDALHVAYMSFADWANANDADLMSSSDNSGFAGYTAAPQVFYYRPQSTWYLIYQTPEPSYSTAAQISDITDWSATEVFMPMPSLLTDNGDNGIDYWIICDDTTCYMFFSALNGKLYRARTPKSLFPNGFTGTTEVVLEDANPLALFDASNVYHVAGTDTYLLLVSAIGSSGRYYRSFTADSLDGTWTPLAAEEITPFVGAANVTGPDWLAGRISHGEIPRTNPDETMTIDPCHLQYTCSISQTDPVDTDVESFSLGLLAVQ